MKQNKKVPANAGTNARTKEKSEHESSFTVNYNANLPDFQEGIRQLLAILPTGRENAVKARKLAAALGLRTRDLTRLVHDARAAGAVILSAFSDNGGFFLPAPGQIGIDEISDFVASMDKRARQIFVAAKSARSALKNVGNDGTT